MGDMVYEICQNLLSHIDNTPIRLANHSERHRDACLCIDKFPTSQF